MNTSATGAPKRPTFLTVLCILSFIGGAWGVIGGLMNVASPPMDAALSEIQSNMDNATAEMGEQGDAVAGLMDGAMAVAQEAAANAVPMGIATIVLALLSLFGVWQMWNLRKQGFYIYTAATLIGLAVPLYFLGFNWLAMMSVGFAGFFGLLFILLYGLNLKHMS